MAPIVPTINSSLPTPHPQHVEQFQMLYRERYGAHLSPEQALEELMHLLTIVRYRQTSIASQGSPAEPAGRSEAADSAF